MFRFALAAIALASAATGHLTISSPHPLPNQPKDPLLADGSNWPCHITSSSNMNSLGSAGASMAAGSAQKLIFDGGGGFNTAVHGGGSCQISITYETDYDKIRDPANWRVIKSIEEGCPTNSKLNLDVNAQGQHFQGPDGTYTGAFQCTDPKTNGVDCLNAFDFDLPKDLPAGKATLSWTWFNNVGNREMYQNCAAATITGGSKDTSYLNTLPEVFVANIGMNQCSTTEDVSVKFPNPGPQLEVKKPTPKSGFTAQADYPAEIPSGSGCAANQGGNASPTKTEEPTSPATTSAPASTNSGGVFAPGGGNSKTHTSFTTKLSTVTASTPAPSSAPAPSSGSSAGCQHPCSTDGDIVCLPGNKWGLCNFGCAVPQGMASGMQCSNGQIEAISPVKRHPHGVGRRHRNVMV